MIPPGRGIVSNKKRTLKMEKLARIYDAEVLPVWSERFGKMLLRGLSLPPKSQVLDVACGTGYPAVEILRRMDETSRLIAIDASSAMLDVARKKVEEMGRKGVFFRTESAAPRLSFADDVYDLVVCNLGIAEMPSVQAALADFARVTAPNGEVRCTLPLEGTFAEFYDIYREVLIKHDKHDALDRLNNHAASHPSVDDCEEWLVTSGLRDTRIEVDEFSMLFKSSREFFFAPVIEYGPLPVWKGIAGKGQEMQDVFWYIKEAIDAYFGGRAFEVTVKAGCLIGRKSDIDEEDVTGQVLRFDESGSFDPQPTPEIVELPNVIDDNMPIEVIAELDAADYPEPSDNGTAELDLAELEEIDDLDPTYDALDPVEFDVELEAFKEGAQRPPHLDED
jgi:ubiquinone/menaquinone biosynthesis C-methylase UbiE